MVEFYAGWLTQDLVASTPLSVSTAEMNSYGFAIHDRQVIDFWGYSNRDIAAVQPRPYARGARAVPADQARSLLASTVH